MQRQRHNSWTEGEQSASQVPSIHAPGRDLAPGLWRSWTSIFWALGTMEICGMSCFFRWVLKAAPHQIHPGSAHSGTGKRQHRHTTTQQPAQIQNSLLTKGQPSKDQKDSHRGATPNFIYFFCPGGPVVSGIKRNSYNKIFVRFSVTLQDVFGECHKNHSNLQNDPTMIT